MELRVDTAFWEALDQLLATKTIVIDRPRQSRHPRFPEVIYPLDYGYLDGTCASDGGGVDVWRGSLAKTGIVGVACTVDLRKSDTELKLIVGCTLSEIDVIHAFHNGSAMMKAALIIRQ